MKKTAGFIAVIIGLVLFSFSVHCASESDEIKNEIEKGFFDSLDSEVFDLLEDFGIDSLDADSIFSGTSESIKIYFSKNLKEKLSDASGWFFMGVCIIMLLSVASGAFDFSSSGDAFLLFSAAVVCVITVGKISTFLNCVLSAIALNGKLMLSFIPVFALVVSLSGNPTAALTYNSFMLFFCEAVNFFAENFFVGVVGACFSLSIGFAFNPAINLGRFINGVNRAASLVLGFCATAFTGVLSLKNVLAVSTDALSVKGVKFLLSSLVPVIGSSLSEAYSSVLGSINLMRSSLAVIGIFALVILNIPAMTEGVVYFFLMTVLSCLAEILGLFRVSEVFRSFAACIRILLLTGFFQVFVLIISIGIMLALRGGVSG